MTNCLVTFFHCCNLKSFNFNWKNHDLIWSPLSWGFYHYYNSHPLSKPLPPDPLDGSPWFLSLIEISHQRFFLSICRSLTCRADCHSLFMMACEMSITIVWLLIHFSVIIDRGMLRLTLYVFGLLLAKTWFMLLSSMFLLHMSLRIEFNDWNLSF